MYDRLIGCNLQAINIFGWAEQPTASEIEQLWSDYPDLLKFYHSSDASATEIRLSDKGDSNCYEISTSNVRNHHKKIISRIFIFRDITNRKRAEEQLIASDRLAATGAMASGIAHEINNPLTGVIGMSQLLLDRATDESMKEDLKLIYDEAQRAVGVTRSLLSFARSGPMAKRPVNLNSIIGQVLKLRAYAQKVNNIQVVIHLAPDMPEIVADDFQLRQVVFNIVINAEFFMLQAHNRGTLTITTENGEGVVRASFADDGSGIAAQNMGHLFAPFFTTKDVGKGTGLGLSICHGIVTAHGGRIIAESEPGNGAKFIVELPLDREKDIQ